MKKMKPLKVISFQELMAMDFSKEKKTNKKKATKKSSEKGKS